jgi:glutathione S-transferase
MSITLYHAPMSSASPVVWEMAELGLEYKSVQLDLKQDKHKQPEFLAMNPMGQVPILVDDGHAMFESCAITIYLGEKYGVERDLWPEPGSAQHMTALTWTTWMAVTVGSTLRQIFATHADWAPAELQHPALNQHASKRLGELMRVLDGHLEDREYIASSHFTLADAYCSAGLTWVTGIVGFDTASTPNMAAWLKRCTSREGAKAMG